MITPILISQFLWSLGQNVESAVYGHLGTQNLAAYTLTCPIQSLIVGALSGLSAAAGVLIGKRLGRREYDAAYAEMCIRDRVCPVPCAAAGHADNCHPQCNMQASILPLRQLPKMRAG